MSGWGCKAALAAMGVGCLGLTGCPAGSRGSAENVDAAGAPQIVITPLNAAQASITNDLEVSTTATDDGFAVVVTAGAELPRVQELFASLLFDNPALTAKDIVITDSAGDAALSAAFPAGPGRIDFGITPLGAPGATLLQPGEQVLSFSLVNLGASDRTASSATPIVTARARNLDLVNEAGEWVLSWDYTNPGDSNQDGEVNISDLKEIGVNFRHLVADQQNDPVRHVDSDSNGEINLGDISAIGVNMRASVYAYNVEMSESGSAPFATVGQLVLGEERANQAPGETMRFSYNFVGQYAPNAWYRVVPAMNNPAGGVVLGTPSEAISEDGRQLTGVEVPLGAKRTVTVYAAGLKHPISHMNACRVIFPSGYKYVQASFNAGRSGGATTPDGIWASFSRGLLLPGDNLLVPVTLADGRQAIDFNVTTMTRDVQASPVGYGDLFNFQLENVEGGPLDLRFELGEVDGVKRTYYSQHLTDDNAIDHYFGNSIGFKVN